MIIYCDLAPPHAPGNIEAPVPDEVKAPVPKVPVPAPITGVRAVMVEEAPIQTDAGEAVAVITGKATGVTTT